MTELETASAARIAELEMVIESLRERVQEVGAIGRREHVKVLELEAELAAMRAGGEPVAWLVTGPYIKQPMAMRCSAEAYMRGLLKSDPDGGYEISPLYTHSNPQPAAQDAERYRLLRRGQRWSVIDGLGDDLRGEVLDYAIDAAIAARKQGDSVQTETDEFVTLIAECRDAFPAPQPGDPLEAHWMAAMCDPGEVPGYLREVAARSAPQPATADTSNLSCKSVQKRLATQWGYVPATADALDAARLDWLDTDGAERVFHLGPTWYTRASYGQPHRKRANLRAAIDAAIAARKQGANHD